MVKKEFTYRGKTVAEMQKMDLKEFMELVPARIRRTLKRGFTEDDKIFLNNLRSGDKKLKTHCRDMVILPEMIGKTIKIHNGKEFFQVMILEDMVGHVLGEFALTRRRVTHNAPGIGATKSSASVSVK